MSFFGSLTGSNQRRDMNKAYADSTATVNKGYDAARNNLASGYGTANQAYGQARTDVNSGYKNALSALASGTNNAVGAYQPYSETGQNANALYGNALGLNGAAAQQTFQRDYQADPFRDANNEFASRAIMQKLNARGLSGSGVAPAAIAQESLRRGSEDYNNYLNRLSGLQSQGQQTAGNVANLYANQGQQGAQYGMQTGSDLANIQGNRAATGYNYGVGQAGLDTDQAITNAGNRINLGNAQAASRGILGNNLMSLLGTGLQAYGTAMGVPPIKK